MTDIPDPPRSVPHPKSIGGKLKNQPKWVWVLGVTVLVGVAYMAYRKKTAAPQDAAVDDGTNFATYDTGATDTGYPAPTQGAYGGGSSLDSGGYGASLPPAVGDGSTEGSGLAPVINLYGSGVTSPDEAIAQPDGAPSPSPVTSAPIQQATGGGPPIRSATAHAAPPKNVVKNGKFYHVYNEGKPSERWVYVRPASGSQQPTAVTPKPTPTLPAQPATRPSSPTGGGQVSGGGTATAASTPKNVVKNGKFYHVYNYGQPGERWVYVRPAA